MGCHQIGTIGIVDEKETRHLIPGSSATGVIEQGHLEGGSMCWECQTSAVPMQTLSTLTYGANDEAKFEELIGVEETQAKMRERHRRYNIWPDRRLQPTITPFCNVTTNCFVLQCTTNCIRGNDYDERAKQSSSRSPHPSASPSSSSRTDQAV